MSEIVNNFTIRRATAADTPAILSCLRAAFEPYQSSYTVGAFVDTVLTAESLASRLKAMSVFVGVTQSGEVIGTIACQVAREGEGHLRGMAVIPTWHGCGVARQLLECAESELIRSKCVRVTLDTTEYLQRAIRFYERNGYRRSGRTSDFFGMTIYEFVKDL